MKDFIKEVKQFYIDLPFIASTLTMLNLIWIVNGILLLLNLKDN